MSCPALTAASLRPSLRSSSHSNDRFTKSSTYSVMKVPDVRARRPTALAVSSTTPVSGLPEEKQPQPQHPFIKTSDSSLTDGINSSLLLIDVIRGDHFKDVLVEGIQEGHQGIHRHLKHWTLQFAALECFGFQLRTSGILIQNPTSPGPSYRKQTSSTAYSLNNHHRILHLWGTRGCDTQLARPQQTPKKKKNFRISQFKLKTNEISHSKEREAGKDFASERYTETAHPFSLHLPPHPTPQNTSPPSPCPTQAHSTTAQPPAAQFILGRPSGVVTGEGCDKFIMW
ncbi:hypothetical protein E2C01_000964 [Portunus trituberculatus]|uniref:Uncharacterized protein n=1 Tax=Portunus trituberculatus TaxID=210409 RepID=A0A5B7CGI0_PORTR|nr:hypothetical protein [Portunus trituberculatus]